MTQHSYVRLPNSLVLVDALVGFHDEGNRLARALRTRFLGRIVTRLSDCTELTGDLLQSEAVDILNNETRSSEIFLTACVLLQEPDGVRMISAGHYDVWHANASGISHVLVGASVWNAASAAGGQADGFYKNILVSALSSDPSKTLVQVVTVALDPADVILITAGEVDPKAALSQFFQGGRDKILVALDEGPNVFIGGLCRLPRSPLLANSST